MLLITGISVKQVSITYVAGHQMLLETDFKKVQCVVLSFIRI